MCEYDDKEFILLRLNDLDLYQQVLMNKNEELDYSKPLFWLDKSHFIVTHIDNNNIAGYPFMKTRIV